MAMIYYLVEGQSRTGPYNADQLWEAVRRGKLSEHAMVVDPRGQPHVVRSLIASAFTTSDPAPEPLPPPVIAASTLVPDARQLRPADGGPTGIGGWLLFFCVQLTILGPLYSYAQIIDTWAQTEPAFELYPSLRTALLWENVGFSAIGVYGFIVGCIVWSGNRHGDSIAKRYLLVRLGSYFVIELVGLTIISQHPAIVEAAIIPLIGGAIVQVGYFSIWWLYFQRSRRVRNTYSSLGEQVAQSASARDRLPWHRKRELATTIEFNCPYCNQLLSVADASAGRRGYCTNCKQLLIVPESPRQTESDAIPAIEPASVFPPLETKRPPLAAQPPTQTAHSNDEVQVVRSVILLIGGALIVASLLFPPWAYTFQRAGLSQIRKPAGYGFLLTPPVPESEESYAFGIVLDWSRLSAQVVALTLLTAGAWFMASYCAAYWESTGRIGPAFLRAMRAMLGDVRR